MKELTKMPVKLRIVKGASAAQMAQRQKFAAAAREAGRRGIPVAQYIQSALGTSAKTQARKAKKPAIGSVQYNALKAARRAKHAAAKNGGKIRITTKLIG
jgi:hypothetical protein